MNKEEKLAEFKKRGRFLLFFSLFLIYAIIAYLAFVIGFLTLENAWLVPFLFPGYYSISFLGISNNTFLEFFILVVGFSSLAMAMGSLLEKNQDLAGCIGICQSICNLIVTLGVASIFFFQRLDLMSNLPLLIFCSFSLIIIFDYTMKAINLSIEDSTGARIAITQKGTLQCSRCGRRLEFIGNLFDDVIGSGGRAITFEQSPNMNDQWMGTVCTNCGRVYCDRCVDATSFSLCPNCGANLSPAMRVFLTEAGVL